MYKYIIYIRHIYIYLKFPIFSLPGISLGNSKESNNNQRFLNLTEDQNHLGGFKKK